MKAMDCIGVKLGKNNFLVILAMSLSTLLNSPGQEAI